jgi:glycosyltransferase involved in cell wall biosynthesis
MNPSVSIVIPAYNAANLIRLVLDACLAQDYADVEVIVVDDGSTDDTGSIVQQYPVKYVFQENSGPAAARNAGWRQAKGEIVCFTDSDCLPAKDWVSRLIERYEADDIAGVGGTYDIANSDSLLAVCVHEEIVQRHLRMPPYVNYLGSFNASYRWRVLRDVKGFDESYRMASGEDNDLAYKVIAMGYRLAFTREAKVAHHHPTRLWRYLRTQFWHGYWRVKLYVRHPGMSRGDAYGGLLDFMRPPLALLTLWALASAFLMTHVAWLPLVLMGLQLALQLPMTLSLTWRTRQAKCFALVPIVFLRGYARAFGMVLGVIRFLILDRLLRLERIV